MSAPASYPLSPRGAGGASVLASQDIPAAPEYARPTKLPFSPSRRMNHPLRDRAEHGTSRTALDFTLLQPDFPAVDAARPNVKPPITNSRNAICSRRDFLRRGLMLTAAGYLALTPEATVFTAGASSSPVRTSFPDAKVAIVSCRTYGTEVRSAMKHALDLLGGIGSLVKNKTVTVKLNLTGTDFTPFLNRPVGETFMTHYSTAFALAAEVFAAGAQRVRFVESTMSKGRLEQTLDLADWDLPALLALGRVEFENTRNLGKAKKYSVLKVPDGGRMFSSLHLNHAYEETDVMVSLCKLKQHVTAGITLSMKNLFGLTPTSLYGEEAGREDATIGRSPLHSSRGFEHIQLPGLKSKPAECPQDPGARVPRIITDICAARPIHLAVIDGITAMSGGEGPWCNDLGALKLTTPGVLIVGLNPVATDAVGAAVMGFANPRALRGPAMSGAWENHLVLAEQAGFGTADLAQIDVRGLTIEKARWPYPQLR